MFSVPFLKFFRAVSLLTLLCIAFAYALVWSDVISAILGRAVTWSTFFFLVVSSLSYYILMSSVNSDKNGSFVKGVVLANVLKILLSILFAVWLLFVFDHEQLKVILIFLAAYLGYSVFVMTFLFSNLRQISEQHKNAKNNNSSR